MPLDLDLSLPTSVGVATYPPAATFGPRRMRDFEFVWITEGGAAYRWGDAVVPVPEGGVVLCRPGAEDAFRWDPDRRTRHGYFHFQVRRVPADWPAVEQWPLVRTPTEGDVLRPLFRHVLTWAGRGDEGLLRLSMAHMLTSFVLGQMAASDLPADALPEPVERALRHVRERLADAPDAPVDLEDLAAVACVTREHLCRLFKASTGHSPVETVRLARLDHAAVLVAQSNCSVKEIAALCGFASAFHFSRRFKDAYGLSPRTLRQRVRDGQTPPTPRLMRWGLGSIGSR